MPEPADPAPLSKPRKRWLPRLRFSLRTLVILVLLIGSAGGLWWRWDPWRLNFTSQFDSRIVSVGIAPDERYFYLVLRRGNWLEGESEFDTVKIVDAESGILLKSISGGFSHSGDGGGGAEIELSPRGRFLLFQSHVGIMHWEKVFDVHSGIACPLEEPKNIRCFGFSPDDRHLLYSNGVKFVIRNLADQTNRMISDEEPDKAIFTSNSQRVVIATRHGKLSVWNVADGKFEQLEAEFPIGGGTLDFSPDNKFICVGGWDTAAAIVYDWPSLKQLQRLPGRPSHVGGYNYWFSTQGLSSPFSKIGDNILTDEGVVHVFKSSDGTSLATLTGFEKNSVCALQFNSTGDRIVGQQYPQFRVWNTLTDQPVLILQESGSASSDAEFILTHGKDAKIYSTHTGDLVTQLSPRTLPIEVSAFSKGHIVAGYSNGCACCWAKTRPEYWWGVAWLPEFWLTALFAGALGWSVWRDRKRIGKSA